MASARPTALFFVVTTLAAASMHAAEDVTAPSLPELVRRYADLQISSQSIAVHGVRFEKGHLILDLVEGRAAAVAAGGEPLGYFFTGKGAFRYRSSDAAEMPVMIHNARKATALGVEAGAREVTVSGDVRTVLLFGEHALPSGSGAAPVREEFLEHRKTFLRDASAPAAHDFAYQRVESPEHPLVRVEIGVDGDDLVFVFDPAWSRSERLYCLRKVDYSDMDLRRYLWPVVLSEQTIGRDRRDPMSPRLVLSDVSLSLTGSAGDAAALTVTETLVPTAPTRLLRMTLLNVSYAPQNFGVEPRSVHLRRVSGPAGQDLAFAHENDDLLVALPSTAAAGQPVTLRFEIEGDMLIRPRGDNYWVLGTEPWFPQPELAGQSYAFRAFVRVKKPYVPFASGTTVSRREEGDYNIVETRMERPDRFAVVMAGSFSFAEETRDGLTVRVASYAGRNELATRQLTDLAFGIVRFYEPFLGPFPFTDLTIIEINEYGWGQAPPGAVFITREAFDSRLDRLAWLYTQGVNERFAHEIAHQYWGHAVFWPNDEEQWISEAFAEYCASLFVKRAMGKVEHNSLLATWRMNARRASDVSTIALANRIANPLNPEEAWRMRNFLIYHKGAWLLSRLHAELGDQVFLTFLKSYQKSFRGKTGSTKHVAGLLQFMTKRDYMQFFESNYWDTGTPE